MDVRDATCDGAATGPLARSRPVLESPVRLGAAEADDFFGGPLPGIVQDQ